MRVLLIGLICLLGTSAMAAGVPALNCSAYGEGVFVNDLGPIAGNVELVMKYEIKGEEMHITNLGGFMHLDLNQYGMATMYSSQENFDSYIFTMAEAVGAQNPRATKYDNHYHFADIIPYRDGDFSDGTLVISKNLKSGVYYFKEDHNGGTVKFNCQTFTYWQR